MDLAELFHVDGKQNISDTGTRPDILKPEDIMPGSAWMCGMPWMKLNVKEAVDSGVIKSVDDIKLDNESKKVFKEGVLLDSSLSHVVNHMVDDPKYSVAKKIIDREKFSGYIYPPLKRSFSSFVRVTAFVLLAVKKFKRGMVHARSLRDMPVSDGSTLESLVDSLVKFSVFGVSSCDVSGLCAAFGVMGVTVDMSSGSKFVRLDDRILSQSLEYIFRKTSAEVIQFNGQKLADKIGITVDGILYCKTRLTEDQDLRVVGGLENVVNLETFTGVKFKVPVLDRYSPVAVSIANHMHYKVVKHKGAETVHRITLQYFGSWVEDL